MSCVEVVLLRDLRPLLAPCGSRAGVVTLARLRWREGRVDVVILLEEVERGYEGLVGSPEAFYPGAREGLKELLAGRWLSGDSAQGGP